MALQPGESVALTALPRHRRLYLHYQGPIAGDRGSVQRVAAGVMRAASHVESAADDPEARPTRLTICWSGEGNGIILQTLLLERVGESGWNLRCETRGNRAE